MSLYTADALILRTYKLGEADRIVVFLTSDRGKRRGVARGACRPRSRFGGGLEPLTHARLSYFEREHRDLVRLIYVEPVCSPLMSRNIEALSHVSYFAELIDEWAPEADPNDKLFRLGCSVGAALTTDVDVDRVARYFEYWLLRLQGVYPSIVDCHRCGAGLGDRGAQIASPQGGLVCWRCGPAHGEADLSAEALTFLRVAARIAPEQLGAEDLSPRASLELASVHRFLIRAYLEKELKSTRVVSELSATRQSSPADGRSSSIGDRLSSTIDQRWATGD